jgi:hypothetical protein
MSPARSRFSFAAFSRIRPTEAASSRYTTKFNALTRRDLRRGDGLQVFALRLIEGLRVWTFDLVCFLVKHGFRFKVRFGPRRLPQSFGHAHSGEADMFSHFVADPAYKDEHGQNQNKTKQNKKKTVVTHRFSLFSSARRRVALIDY